MLYLRLVHFQEDISAIFKVADKDNSGTLTVKEIQDILEDICIRYPQVELYLKSKQMRGIADLIKDAKGDIQKESIELNIEEFKKALANVDSQVKNLPATAQVNRTTTIIRVFFFLMYFVVFFDSFMIFGIGCCTTRKLSCTLF